MPLLVTAKPAGTPATANIAGAHAKEYDCVTVFFAVITKDAGEQARDRAAANVADWPLMAKAAGARGRPTLGVIGCPVTAKAAGARARARAATKVAAWPDTTKGAGEQGIPTVGVIGCPDTVNAAGDRASDRANTKDAD